MDEQSLQVRRGDSFDIGEDMPAAKEADIINILRNPKELTSALNLTDKQAANVRSILVGSGTGGIHRLLSEHLGDEISAVIGALVSSYISRKIIKK